MKILHIAAGLPSKERPFQQPFIKGQIDSLRKQNLNIGVFEIKGYNSKYSYIKAIKEIRTKVAIDNSDVIHAHYSYCGIITYLAKTNRPIVLSLMGSDLLGTRNKNGKVSFRGKVDKIITSIAVNKVDHVIVKSESMKRLIRTGIPVSVIPNGVDFEMFNPQNAIESRIKLGLNQNDFIILFLGEKNSAVKNYQLAFQAVNKFKLAYKMNNTVFINPYGIAHEKVADYMNAADVMLLTSFYEGSPNVVKEAMACNLPIISTDVGDVKEIIKDTDYCFMTGCSEEEISEKLKIIYNKRERSNGRKNIESLRDDLIARKIINIYEKVLSNKN